MKKDNYNDVVYTDGEFSIRHGIFSYFISHDNCARSAFTMDLGRKPATVSCEKCNIKPPEEMIGFIRLLDWER